MWFGTLILKNLVRRPLRSALTIIAIAIAIGSVVSLVGIASGFENSFREIYDRKGIDIFVLRSGTTQRLNSSLPERLGDQIAKLPGVKEVIPGLVDIVVMPGTDNINAALQGWNPDTPVFDTLTILKGRKLSTSDQKAVMLGTVLARNLGKTVGDKIQLINDGDWYEVVGVHETHNVLENGALVMPLKELQEVMGRKDQVTGYSVILDEEAKRANPDLVPETRAVIEKLDKNVSALSLKDHLKSLTEIQLVKAMAWLTSAIALMIGLFGVMNTMVMAVNERTREIGILRAVGWRPRRVMRLVLLEAVVLSLVGAVVGMIGSLVLVKALTSLPMVSGIISGDIQGVYFFYGFVISLAVGLLGGLLPARRAAKLLPTVALRQE
jgi:putative ABC transport system permease protein